MSLRLVPEIHHGPVQRTFQALPTASPIGPQEFIINSGQQEETIRELATTLVLEPGQIAVIGCRPEYKRSLGSFMLTQSVAHSDQRGREIDHDLGLTQPPGTGNNDDASSTTDRPRLLQRLMGPTPTPMHRPNPTPPAGSARASKTPCRRLRPAQPATAQARMRYPIKPRSLDRHVQ